MSTNVANGGDEKKKQWWRPWRLLERDGKRFLCKIKTPICRISTSRGRAKKTYDYADLNLRGGQKA